MVFGANKTGRIFAVDVSAANRIALVGARETRERDELGWPHDVASCGDLLVVVSREAFPDGADDAHDLVHHARHLFVTAQNSHSLVILKAGGMPR